MAGFRQIRNTGLLATVLLVALFAPGPNQAALAAICPASGKAPKIHLKILLGKALLDDSLGRDQIKRLSDKNIGYTQGPWHIPLGLTVGETSAHYETNFVYRRVRGGTYCVYLTEAKIEVGYTDLTVYVSSEYAEGSCQYEAILAHEMEHVEIGRNVLLKHKERLRKALALTARGKRKIHVYTKAEARSAYILAFQRSLEPVLRAFTGDESRANARIDSEKSYRKIFAKCDDW